MTKHDARTITARTNELNRRRTMPDARTSFSRARDTHTTAIAALKLTKPQANALKMVTTGTGPAISDRMFSTLEALGLVTAHPTATPHRAQLSRLGTAYVRRQAATATKGGKK